MNEYDMNIQYGWVCPKCGRVMAPTMPFCPCNGESVKITATTGTAPTGRVDWLHHETITTVSGRKKDETD